MTLVRTGTTTREQRLLIPVPQVEPRVAIPLQNLRRHGLLVAPPFAFARGNPPRHRALHVWLWLWNRRASHTEEGSDGLD